MNYMKLLNLEIALDNYLNDILECTKNTCDYLLNPNTEVDKYELTSVLSSLPEYIKIIKELFQKIEEEYENERN